MSTADKLNALILTKADIKLALIDKGLNPTDVFSTYADDIRAIETGGTGRDWSLLGYSGEPDIFDEGFDYGVSLLERVEANGSDRNILNELSSNKKLLYLPNLDWVKVGTNYSGARGELISQNPNLEYADIVDMSKTYKIGDRDAYLSTGSLFWNCPKLKKVKHLILPEKEDGSSLAKSFNGCTSLTDVNITGKVNSLLEAFSSTKLNKIPELDISLCTTMLSCFSNASIPEADFSNWDFSNVETLRNLFFQNSSNTTLKKVNFTGFNAPKCTQFDQMFYECSGLNELIIPEGFGKGVENFYSMFRGCRSLSTDLIDKMDTSSGTNLGGMFMYFTNSNDTELDLSWLDLTNATTIAHLVYGCESLQYLNLSGLNTRNADINNLIYNCSKMIKIDGELSIYSTTSFMSYNWLVGYSVLNNLRYLTLKDIGESGTSLSMKNLGNWGVEDETIELSAGARKSMIDSLIKYSYDRVTNGLNAYDITLSTNTKALLTEEEIAQITAKGFTIV